MARNYVGPDSLGEYAEGRRRESPGFGRCVDRAASATSETHDLHARYPSLAFPCKLVAALPEQDRESTTRRMHRMSATAPQEWRKLYPFEDHEIRVGPHRYHYIEEGAGEPVLMVHGNPTWSFYWRNLVLATRTEFRAIAVDHIGCGLSDKPQQYDYTLETHIDNLVQLITEKDLSDINLLVHDWGGAIGLGAAVRMPDRFKRLVLFNTGAFPPPFIPLRINVCRIPWFGQVAIQGFNAFARAATVMAVEDRHCLSSDVKSGLIAPYDSWSDRIANYRFVRDIPGSPRHPTWKTLDQIELALPTLADRPVQMIWGMKDWCFRPECLDRLIKSFPAAEVHRLADVGHYVVEEGVDEVIPLVQGFLKREAC